MYNKTNEHVWNFNGALYSHVTLPHPHTELNSNASLFLSNEFRQIFHSFAPFFSFSSLSFSCTIYCSWFPFTCSREYSCKALIIPITQLNFWKHDFCSGIFRIVCMCILNQVINLNCNKEEIFWHAHYYVGYAKNSILQMEIPFEKWFCDYSVFALFQYTRNFGNELYKTFVMKTA